MNCETYTNHETFLISNDIHNDADKLNYWRGQRDICWAVPAPNDVFTRSALARYTLAEELKQVIEASARSLLTKGSTLLTDLLFDALSGVAWHELSDELLCEEGGPAEYERTPSPGARR